MDTQVKFSDIIRYVLLGGVAIAYFFLWGYILNIEWMTELLALAIDNASSMVVLIVIGFASFLIGVLLQSIRSLVEYWPRVAVSKYRPNAPWWKKVFYKISEFVLYGTIFELCHHQKANRKYADDLPMWIYLSDNPSATLNFIRGRLSKEINSESNSLGESFYYHELFMGLEYALFLVPISILIFWNKYFDFSTPGMLTLLITCGVAITTVRFLAKMESKKYLRYINSLYDIFDDYANSHHPFFSARMPIVYVLIRTVDLPGRMKHITRAVESVLHQNYPNKRIIILEDLPEGVTGKGKEAKCGPMSLVVDIEAELHRQHGDKPDHIDSLQKIVTYKRAEEHIGASGTSHDIREIFLNEANERDIAVLLDDDDFLDRNDALTEIAVRMSATNAGMGLLTFRNVSDMGCVLSNGGGKFHNQTVKKLARVNKSVDYLDEFIFADTLGWTKVYSYEMMKRYVESIDNFDKLKDSPIKYRSNPAFEDFPDFICFLLPGAKVCAIDRPTHCYFKRDDSITGSKDLTAFEYRCGFLAYTMELVEFLSSNKNNNHRLKLSECDIRQTKRFITYKIGVICNIIMTKFAKEYSIEKFIGLCLSDKSSESLRSLLVNERDNVRGYLEEFIENKSLTIVAKKDAFIGEIMAAIDRNSQTRKKRSKDAETNG